MKNGIVGCSVVRQKKKKCLLLKKDKKRGVAWCFTLAFVQHFVLAEEFPHVFVLVVYERFLRDVLSGK